MGAQRPSSVTAAQSLQYYACSNEFVHDKQAKSIIDNDYLSVAVKSRNTKVHSCEKSKLYRLVIYHKR